MVSIILPVIIKSPFQRELTKFSVWCMRNLTSTKHEVVIVETISKQCEDLADIYIHRSLKTSYSSDWNAGADAASGSRLVHIGNDIIVSDGWLEGLLACYDYEDCGVASLACTEPGAGVGPREPIERIVEGWYGPLMMVPSDCRLDTAFPGLGSDTDLILRQYEAWKRAYRNDGVVCHHFDGVTYRSKPAHERLAETRAVHQQMVRRWGHSPLWAVQMVLKGYVGRFGQEGE